MSIFVLTHLLSWGWCSFFSKLYSTWTRYPVGLGGWVYLWQGGSSESQKGTGGCEAPPPIIMAQLFHGHLSPTSNLFFFHLLHIGSVSLSVTSETPSPNGSSLFSNPNFFFQLFFFFFGIPATFLGLRVSVLTRDVNNVADSPSTRLFFLFYKLFMWFSRCIYIRSLGEIIFFLHPDEKK
jgi:hypothetical protein